MVERQSDSQSPTEAAGSQQLLSTRALLIIVTAVLAGVTVAVQPALAVPVGVSLAVVTLLARILGN